VLLLSAVIGVSSLTTGCGLVGHESCSPAPLTVSPTVLHPGSTAVVRSKGYPCHTGSVRGSETAILALVYANNDKTVGKGLVAKNGSFEFVIHIPTELGSLPVNTEGKNAFVVAEGPTGLPCAGDGACPLYEAQVVVAFP